MKAIQLLNVRAHKQTKTTQRWKMAIKYGGSDIVLPTKIECSRRAVPDNSAIAAELINPDIIRTYELPPIFAMHYKAHSAFSQKLSALLDRRVTQARDIFDLHFLRQRESLQLDKVSLSFELVGKLSDRILAIDFDTFYSQVVTFLEPTYQDHYSNPVYWEQMQLELIDYLESCYESK